MKENIEKIKEIISSRRKKTNCFAFFDEIEQWIQTGEADIYLDEGNIFLFLRVNRFYKLYYFVNSFEEIGQVKKFLQNYLESDISLEFTTKHEKNLSEVTKALKKTGFSLYAEFARLLSGVNKLKVEEEVTNGFFELATLADTKDLLEIMHKEFDPITDNIPSEEELKRLIETKSIAVHHIDEKIIYIQIYEYTKGVLYSRMTWIKKKYRKPKYTVDIYKGIDEYIKQLNIENYQNLRCYFWVNTAIKNYKINIKQGAKLDGIKCFTFKYGKDEFQKS